MNIGRLVIIVLASIAVVTTAVAGDPATATKSFVHRQTKEAKLELIVHFPPGWKEKDQRPAIVFFFGGGWNAGSVKQFEPQSQYLAGRGMVAIRADYRVKSRHGVSPDQCVEDAKSAIRFVRKNAKTLGIDPERIVASGGSAGGHLAACTALGDGLEGADADLSVSSKPNALVLFNPVLRFTGYPELMERINNDEKIGKAISPTLHLQKDSPPTLILFGTADKLLTHGEEFVKKAKELGQRAELFTAAGQAHGFFNKSPWQERTLKRADEFLIAIGYLKGEPTIQPK
ncbi:MAG: alpha/beta hydrolase [Gemmataceae bacterium]|nr:alpha/beta hydrolase [Gemmataceae bacterium]MCI0743142.1 alpha/beta hydrolase [Gemmataceae bacterium]